MEGLPFLPGNSFTDPTKQAYHRSHTLNYKNGYQQPVKKGEVISEQELNELANFNPVLTYGQAKQAPPVDFIPSFVAFDKKVLSFNAYWKETVNESSDEYYRVRPVKIYYYLEDDSISVIEPQVKNSGIPQGKFIQRQRLPKDDQGNNWHWKDLNVGMNVTFYGKVFRLTDCDKFTKEFLESEGIVMNCPESTPLDPYITKREHKEEMKKSTTRSDYDKQRQFLEMDRKVLRFYCIWDDRDAMFGEMRPFILHYFLVDDTMEVREVHEPNDGRDPFPILIGRHRVPKDRYNVKPSHPSVSMELTPAEISQYFTPNDFRIGCTIYIYGRKVLIYDVDQFTKAWYYQNFGLTDFEPLDVKQHRPDLPKMEIPPYNQYGSMEDSLQNVLKTRPTPPKKDIVKLMENEGMVLRYEAILDSVHSEDQGRKFIIQYRLADDMTTVFESRVKNSGHRGGKFLERSRVAKPGSTPDTPQFYGPEDFYIGAVIEIFKHRFVITNCDDFVLKFMEENPEKFPETTRRSVRNKLMDDNTQPACHPRNEGVPIQRMPGDIEPLVNEICMHMKKLGITGKDRIDRLFLQLDKDRTGYIDRDGLKNQLKIMYLPTDNDIVDCLLQKCSKTGDGRVRLADFRRFIENP